MSLSIRSLGITAAIVWGGSIFLVGLVGMAAPGYGGAFLQLPASLYPGYHATGGFVDLIIGTLYGLVDGLVCGVIFAWIYNRLAGAA